MSPVMTGLMASAATSGLAAWFEQQKMEFTLNFIMKDRWKLLVTGLQNTLIIAVLGLLIGIVIGVVGMGMALSTYPIYKKILSARKKKYAPRIMELSEKLLKK